MIIVHFFLIQIIGLFHIFSNSDPGKARVMVWVLGGLTGLSGYVFGTTILYVITD